MKFTPHTSENVRDKSPQIKKNIFLNFIRYISRGVTNTKYALICTLKNSEKYFQIFHEKIKLKIIILKNSKFSFKGGFVPDIFAGGEG